MIFTNKKCIILTGKKFRIVTSNVKKLKVFSYKDLGLRLARVLLDGHGRESGGHARVQRHRLVRAPLAVAARGGLSYKRGTPVVPVSYKRGTPVIPVSYKRGTPVIPVPRVEATHVSKGTDLSSSPSHLLRRGQFLISAVPL